MSETTPTATPRLSTDHLWKVDVINTQSEWLSATEPETERTQHTSAFSAVLLKLHRRRRCTRMRYVTWKEEQRWRCTLSLRSRFGFPSYFEGQLWKRFVAVFGVFVAKCTSSNTFCAICFRCSVAVLFARQVFRLGRHRPHKFGIVDTHRSGTGLHLSNEVRAESKSFVNRRGALLGIEVVELIFRWHHGRCQWRISQWQLWIVINWHWTCLVINVRAIRLINLEDK